MDEVTPKAVALEEATVAFRLGDGRVYTAVEKAQLSVAQGEFVAIVGPTGCGKSTLLNVAAGLLKPAAGTAKIFGRPLVGSTATPAISSRPMRCFPGRPHSTMSRSASKYRARRAPRRWCARING